MTKTWRGKAGFLATVTIAIGLALAGCWWWQHGGKTGNGYFEIIVPVANLYATPPLNGSNSGVNWTVKTGLPVNVCFQGANNPFTTPSPITIAAGQTVPTAFRPNVAGTFYFTNTAGTMCPNPDPIESTPHIIIVKNE